jgi:hypothetical protein
MKQLVCAQSMKRAKVYLWTRSNLWSTTLTCRFDNVAVLASLLLELRLERLCNLETTCCPEVEVLSITKRCQARLGNEFISSIYIESIVL